MTEATDVIRKQIESCRELLKIFQNERQLYLDRPNINLDDVTRILCRKKQLVEIFDQQQQVIRDFKAQAAVNNSPEDKELMRELGSILEQLLVIDHENEKLLRHCLSTRNPMAAAVSAAADEEKSVASAANDNAMLRTRPALQRQLPFVPGARPVVQPFSAPATASRLTPAVVPVPAPAPIRAEANAGTDAEVESAGVPRPAARHLIRNYVQTANLLHLSSKYA